MKRYDLEILLTCGSSISVDAKKYTLTDLQLLALRADSGEGMLTIRNADHLGSENLRQISSYGKKNVTFIIEK